MGVRIVNKITVWFDMDGTIADLYGVTNWLELLRQENASPYQQAGTLINMSQLAKLLHKLQKNNYHIGIISWTGKQSSANYERAIDVAKRAWLAKHLPSITWDEIQIVRYGTNKAIFKHTDKDILFDDEKNNRIAWNGIAYQQTQIIKVLKALT